MSDTFYATNEALYRLTSEQNSRLQLNAFHLSTRTWRPSRLSSLLNKEDKSTESSLDLPGTSHLPEAVVQQLAMLRRSTSVEKAFPLGSSVVLVRSPDHVIIAYSDRLRRVRRHAMAPRIDFAFEDSDGSIIYGGVNIVKRACLQVERASSVEEFEEAVSSGCMDDSIYRRYPSTSSDNGPNDFSRSVYSMDDNRLTVVTPINGKDDECRLSIVHIDLSSKQSSEKIVTVHPSLLSSFWSRRRQLWKNIIVSIVKKILFIIDIQTGRVQSRPLDELISSFCITPNGQLLLIQSNGSIHSSSHLQSPSLSDLVRDVVISHLPYSRRVQIPTGLPDSLLVSQLID